MLRPIQRHHQAHPANLLEIPQIPIHSSLHLLLEILQPDRAQLSVTTAHHIAGAHELAQLPQPQQHNVLELRRLHAKRPRQQQLLAPRADNAMHPQLQMIAVFDGGRGQLIEERVEGEGGGVVFVSDAPIHFGDEVGRKEIDLNWRLGVIELYANN